MQLQIILNRSARSSDGLGSGSDVFLYITEHPEEAVLEHVVVRNERSKYFGGKWSYGLFEFIIDRC